MKKTQKGFTLIELMIVVAIIGILAAIAIPKFAQMLEKSREGATKGNISAIKSAISIYYGDHEGEWPDNLTEEGSVGWSFLESYMDDLPKVKVTGNNESNSANTTSVNPSGSTFSAFYFLPDTSVIESGVTDTGGSWIYQVATGKIWVNSSLQDSKGDYYTTFGYQ